MICVQFLSYGTCMPSLVALIYPKHVFWPCPVEPIRRRLLAAAGGDGVCSRQHHYLPFLECNPKGGHKSLPHAVGWGLPAHPPQNPRDFLGFWYVGVRNEGLVAWDQPCPPILPTYPNDPFGVPHDVGVSREGFCYVLRVYILSKVLFGEYGELSRGLPAKLTRR